MMCVHCKKEPSINGRICQGCINRYKGVIARPIEKLRPINEVLQDYRKNGAEKMLEVVKRWLNTEPIEKEIWEAWEK